MGRVASHTSPFTFAANTFRANPSLIDFAISNAELPAAYSLMAPSGKVIFIINLYLRLGFKNRKFNEVLPTGAYDYSRIKPKIINLLT